MSRESRNGHVDFQIMLVGFNEATKQNFELHFSSSHALLQAENPRDFFPSGAASKRIIS